MKWDLHIDINQGLSRVVSAFLHGLRPGSEWPVVLDYAMTDTKNCHVSHTMPPQRRARGVKEIRFKEGGGQDRQFAAKQGRHHPRAKRYPPASAPLGSSAAGPTRRWTLSLFYFLASCSGLELGQ